MRALNANSLLTSPAAALVGKGRRVRAEAYPRWAVFTTKWDNKIGQKLDKIGGIWRDCCALVVRQLASRISQTSFSSQELEQFVIFPDDFTRKSHQSGLRKGLIWKS